MWKWISEAVNRNAYFIVGDNERSKELASETLVYLVENKTIAEKIYASKSVPFLIKVMKAICQEETIIETFGKSGSTQKVHYSFYKNMKKISDEYGIPLIEKNAYIFYALCQTPSVAYAQNIIKNALDIKFVALDENKY